MMTDARSIAIDGQGNIYVGEYSGGRIQVFDSTGRFLRQWTTADPKMPLRGMTVDRKGTVYVAQRGIITRYDGETGESLGTLKYSEGDGFDDVMVAPDGGLICAWYRGRDDLVRFNAQGNLVRTIRAAVSTAADRSELNTRVAIDGRGDIYALGGFTNSVFKFSSDGRFINRFGSPGHQPGQISGASAIAVDGKGRVYVSDVKGVQVFDSEGRYLAVFKPGGVASGMVFNDRNELLIASRSKVLKFAINQ
jgi:sugar lactone lactonase YvrE